MLTKEDLSSYRIACNSVPCPSHEKTLTNTLIYAGANADAEAKARTTILALLFYMLTKEDLSSYRIACLSVPCQSHEETLTNTPIYAGANADAEAKARATTC